MPNQVVLAIFAYLRLHTGGAYTPSGEYRDGGALFPKSRSPGHSRWHSSASPRDRFLHHLMHSIQIDTIMDKVRLRTLGLVDQLYPESDTADRQVRTPPSPG